jgi:hypothetical protein
MSGNIIFAVLIGGLVGMVGHVRRRGKIIKPRRTKRFIYLGFFEEVIMGALAAVLLIVSSDTDSLFKIIFISFIAGFGGETIIRSLDFFRSETKSENPLNSTAEEVKK